MICLFHVCDYRDKGTVGILSLKSLFHIQLRQLLSNFNYSSLLCKVPNTGCDRQMWNITTYLMNHCWPCDRHWHPQTAHYTFVSILCLCSNNLTPYLQIRWNLYAFFWVIPRRLNFTCRRFRTLCLFHLHRPVGIKFDQVWKCWSIYTGKGLARKWPQPIGRSVTGYSYWLRLFSSQTFSHINTPTFSNLVILHTYQPMKTEQSVPKHQHVKFGRRGITQKKAYNIQNTPNVWN
jgi:hypothetical protein